MADGRRRRWFPLSTTWSLGSTGSRIQERYGLEGLAVWAAYLATCKRGEVPGEFEYTGESDGWRRLFRQIPDPIPFTLDEFFTYTGRALHKTRRVRRGAVITIVCLPWAQWNERAESDLKTNRKRTRNESKTSRETPCKTAENTAAYSDSDRDIEKEPPSPPAGGAAAAAKERRPDALWDTLSVLFGEVTNRNERGRRNKALALIRESLATAGVDDEAGVDEIIRRASAWSQVFPAATLTPNALANHWAELGRPALPTNGNRRTTGWRWVRGVSSGTYVRDPEGSDQPPPEFIASAKGTP